MLEIFYSITIVFFSYLFYGFSWFIYYLEIDVFSTSGVEGVVSDLAVSEIMAQTPQVTEPSVSVLPAAISISVRQFSVENNQQLYV